MLSFREERFEAGAARTPWVRSCSERIHAEFVPRIEVRAWVFWAIQANVIGRMSGLKTATGASLVALLRNRVRTRQLGTGLHPATVPLQVAFGNPATIDAPSREHQQAGSFASPPLDGFAVIVLETVCMRGRIAVVWVITLGRLPREFTILGSAPNRTRSRRVSRLPMPTCADVLLAWDRAQRRHEP